MRYPVVIHKDPDSDYGVTVPDLPGCFSAGETMDEALDQVVEAVELHIESMLLAGEPIPAPLTVEHHRNDPDYANGIWAVVFVDITKISGKAQRVNVTIPERILSMVDAYALRNGKTRSGFIAEAAVEYIASQSGKGE